MGNDKKYYPVLGQELGQKKAVQDDFYLFLVGDVYYVKFRNPATRELLTKKSTGQRSKTLAMKWAREEWERRCKMAGVSKMSLGEYATPFFTGQNDDPFEIRTRADGRHLAVKTRIDYRTDLNKYILTDNIAQKTISLITRVDSIDFRDRLIAQFGFSRKSKRIFQSYKNIIHTALEKGLTQIDSVNRLNVSYDKRRRAAVGISDLKKLFKPDNWENPTIRLAAITAGMIGLRAGEIRGIKWGDIDLKNEEIHILREIIEREGIKLPKWGKTRTTVYPKSLQALLEPLRGDPDQWLFSVSKRGPIAYCTLREGFVAAVQKAEIPEITLHGLRHSIQTALRGRGVNPELLRATFGWGDEDVQEGYTHRDLYDLSPQMEHTDNLFNELNPMEKE
jgi:integrase